MIFDLGNRIAQIDPHSFVAPSASIIGLVEMAPDSSAWFNAVLRGDNEPIYVGPKTNVQDGAVIHTDPGYPVHLGEGVTVGHQTIVHGATVGDFSLIGMQAVVMNGAKVGKYCLIGAGALLTEGMEIPEGSMVLGAPAKTIKPLPDDAKALLIKSAEVYCKKAMLYRKELKEADTHEVLQSMR